MSAPEPDFDQLLSDHLDGRLDEADAQMLQQSMRDNPDLQSRFDVMRADREALRTLFASQLATGPRLSGDFAARVLAESRRRGLPTGNKAATSDKHTTAPQWKSVRGEVPQASPSRRRLAFVIGLVATAAAVLLIVSMNVREQQTGNNTAAIAQNLPAHQLPSAPRLPTEHLTELDQGEVPTLPVPEIAAANVESKLDPLPVPEVASPPQPSPAIVASVPAPVQAMERSSSVSAVNTPPTLAESPFAGGMIVYDVRLSPHGRETNVMSEAMRQVGLQDAPRLPVNREVIAAAKQADTFDDDAKFQVIFVQASAKSVDRLFLKLLREPQLVEGVRLSLITDAPILKKANNLARVDATKVRHDAQQFSFELENNANNELASFRELLGEQSFAPLPAVAARTEISQPESLSSTGSDVISHVLILVR